MILIFLLFGACQSIIFPIIGSVISKWYSTEYRGLISGAYSTSGNLGNIFGLQSAVFILDS
jgi:sugar phosphate permease